MELQRGVKEPGMEVDISAQLKEWTYLHQSSHRWTMLITKKHVVESRTCGGWSTSDAKEVTVPPPTAGHAVVHQGGVDEVAKV